MISADRLKRFKFFRETPDALLEKLGRVMDQKKFDAGAVICKEGEAGGALYLIETGAVAIEKKAFEAEATSKVVARLDAGDFFGEMAFLQGLPHSATVVAGDDTTLFLLSRDALDALARKDPALALEQLMTVAMGLSGRLRSTTRELVSVYEVARAVGISDGIEALAAHVIGQIQLDFGSTVSVAFYRWNMFNDEYSLIKAQGPASDFPSTLEPSLTPPFPAGQFAVSPIAMAHEKQGALVVKAEGPLEFGSSERQMMETVSAVLAPAIASVLHQEEEEARRRLERSKQTGYSL